MLTSYRRHLARCKHSSRRHKGCTCPIWVQGTLRGESIRRSLEVRNWETAQHLIRDMELGKVKSVFMRDACDRFMTDLEARGLSKDTIAKQKRLTDSLCDFFGNTLVSSLSVDDLARFRESWDLANITARKQIERVRSIFRFFIDREWIAKNPASALKLPKDSQIERKPFEKSELERIEWAIPLFSNKGIYREVNRDRLWAFVSVLRWTGLRIRDVVSLKRSVVKDGYIIIRTTKNGKPIKLVLHLDVEESLEKIAPVGDYFFWSGEGNIKSCVGDWQRTLRRLSTLSGVHVHAHRFRHTFIVELLSRGVSISEVAAIVGNSPGIIEKHYSQWVQVRQDALDAGVRKVFGL